MVVSANMKVKKDLHSVVKCGIIKVTVSARDFLTSQPCDASLATDLRSG